MKPKYVKNLSRLFKRAKTLSKKSKEQPKKKDRKLRTKIKKSSIFGRLKGRS